VTAGGDLPMMTSENNYTQPERLDFERCLSVLGLDADDWGGSVARVRECKDISEVRTPDALLHHASIED